MMDPVAIEALRRAIKAGEEHYFYCMHPWKELRAYVLKLDKYECQRCKARGRYSKAEVVHHVKHLKDRPVVVVA